MINCIEEPDKWNKIMVCTRNQSTSLFEISLWVSHLFLVLLMLCVYVRFLYISFSLSLSISLSTSPFNFFISSTLTVFFVVYTFYSLALTTTQTPIVTFLGHWWSRRRHEYETARRFNFWNTWQETSFLGCPYFFIWRHYRRACFFWEMVRWGRRCCGTGQNRYVSLSVYIPTYLRRFLLIWEHSLLSGSIH